MLWAQARDTSEGCAQLFRADAADVEAPVGSGVRDALAAIGAMRREPEMVAPEQIGNACEQLSINAAEQGWWATAMLLAEAGAHADASNVRLVLRVGQMARRAADYLRAEPWLRLAFREAARRGDWVVHCTAAQALGNLCWQRGNMPRARRWNVRALAVARQYGIRHVQAEALHALFVLDVQARDFPRAELYCRAAFELMETRSPALYRLAHDVAWSYLERGLYDRAAAILEALLPHFGHPDERILVWASLARAAGGAGRPGMYRRAADAVIDLAEHSARGTTCPDALLMVARGAAALRLPSEAESVARMAMALARARSEGEVAIRAEELIESLTHEFARADRATADVPEAASDPDLTPELVRALG